VYPQHSINGREKQKEKRGLVNDLGLIKGGQKTREMRLSTKVSYLLGRTVIQKGNINYDTDGKGGGRENEGKGLIHSSETSSPSREIAGLIGSGGRWPLRLYPGGWFGWGGWVLGPTGKTRLFLGRETHKARVALFTQGKSNICTSEWDTEIHYRGVSNPKKEKIKGMHLEGGEREISSAFEI